MNVVLLYFLHFAVSNVTLQVLERHYAASVGQTVGKSEREAMDFLQASVC